MAKSKQSISALGYDLPELDDVDPTRKPWRHFVKGDIPGQLKEVAGRRPSPQLCVPKLRVAVGEWRKSNYAGASETTKRLFQWWFHEAQQGEGGFRAYFAQREAIETIVYLLEMCDAPNMQDLITEYHEIQAVNLVDTELGWEHNSEGELQVRIPGHSASIDLAPDDVARYAIKAATGSGKTMIMALYVVWSYFHSLREVGSKQASNFLIVAPNVIVFERLKADFANANVFRNLRLSPPEWQLNLHVILRGDAIEPVGRGNLVVTNIHQLYDAKTKWTPKNAVEKILGRAVVRGAAPGRAILDRIQSMKSLAVLNDEAHHLWDPELEWNQILSRLHKDLDDGLTAWLDFSATPKLNSGSFFPWIISDYPLPQAVEDAIVKTPILVKTGIVEPANAKKKTKKQTKVNAYQYAQWIRVGVERLKVLERGYKGVKGAKPVMFVMCENVAHAEDVAKYLRDGRQGFGIKDEEILVIHTKGKGEIKDSDLDELRRQSRLIDQDESKIRVVVSVLILREGWDVRNVSVVLGLRPANSKNEILPEQAIGRGLRLMRGVHGRQVLEVIGTKSFEDLIGQLEVEGVHIDRPITPPKHVQIEPLLERKAFDIEIPRTGPLFYRNNNNLAKLDASEIPVEFTAKDLHVDLAVLRAHAIDIASGAALGKFQVPEGVAPLEGDVLGGITRQALVYARLPEGFATLYPIVRKYVKKFAFGTEINLEIENVRRLLALPVYEQWLAASIADAIGRIVTEPMAVRLEPSPLVLSATAKFVWRRETTKAKKTIFNFVATFNKFESEFGEFLDKADDVKAFAALAETFTRFSVTYLKPTGAMGLYYPDWVVRQRVAKEDRFWIVETKGREFDGVQQKDAAIMHWCSEVSKAGSEKWGYLRVNQDWWDAHPYKTFEDAVKGVQANQAALGVSNLFFWP